MEKAAIQKSITLVDAHAHTWEYSRRCGIKAVCENQYFRDKDFGINGLEGTLRANGVSAAYLVQANPELAETRRLLDLAARKSFVAGVVGWVDLENAVGPQLETLEDTTMLVAIRAQLPRFSDDYISRENVRQALKEIAAKGMTISILANNSHHDRCINTLDALPDATVVLNHCGWPILDGSDQSNWRRYISRYAARKNTFVQVSGIANRSLIDVNLETLLPIVDYLLKSFGPDRLVFGSDWPMLCSRNLGYSDWISLVYRALLEIGLSESEIEDSFSKTASRLYSAKHED